MDWVRRRWRWLGPCLVLGLALAWAWFAWLPREVAERAERELVRRTGLGARIGDVDLGLRGVVLEEVRLASEGRALVVDLSEIGVRVWPWEALGGGLGAVEYIQVRGGRVTLDLAHPTTSAVLSRFRGESSTGGGRLRAPGRDAHRPVVEARDVDLAIRDGDGALVSVDGLSVRLEGGELRLAGRRIVLGGDAGDRATFERGWVTVGRETDRSVRLRSVVAERAEVHWAAPIIEGEADRSGRPPEIRARVMDAVHVVFGSPPEEAAGDASPEDEPSTVARIFGRLSPDLRIDVGDLTFHGEATGGEPMTIHFTELLFGRTEDGRLHAVGSGDGGAHGQARWNLLFDPSNAQAEGDLRLAEIPMGFVAPLLPFVPLHRSGEGEISADLRLRVTPEAEVQVEGRVAVQDVALASRRIGDRPVTGISAALDGSGVWYPRERRLVVESGHLTLGEVTARLSGELAVGEGSYRVRMDASLPSTSCQAVLEAIPSDVLGPVGAFRLAGTLGGAVKVRVDSTRLDATELEVQVADGCEFVAVPAMAEIYRFDRPFAHQVVEPDGSVFTMVSGPGSASWAPYAAIHPNVIAAILGHEDGSFFQHSGFAPWAIREALIRNLEAGAFRYGASTISMQLAKNLFLRREKTLVRKVQEVFLTWWLERALQKQEILELYLNVIEYGPAIYGIRNATRHYFGREPSDVSPAEAAFLATVLPSPKSFDGMYQAGTPSGSTLRRMEQFLRHLNARGRLGAHGLAYGLAELDGFHFHREGEPPPSPRVLPGDAGYASDAEDVGGEATEDDAWAVPDVPEGG